MYFKPMPQRELGLGVDLAAKSVYAAARNLVFGLILLTRCRLWAATQVNPQNSECCRQRDARAGVQQEARKEL
jgi:hypothetical protein